MLRHKKRVVCLPIEGKEVNILIDLNYTMHLLLNSLPLLSGMNVPKFTDNTARLTL